MNIISVVLARSIWLINALELNPQGKSFSPVLPILQNDYKFKKIPLAAEADLSKGILFKEGDFKTKNNELISVDLTFYNDGLMADTRSSTYNSDEFLDDLLVRIVDTLSLPNYKKGIRSKLYLSQLIVTTDKSLEIINPKLKNISKELSLYFSHPYELGSLSFWPKQDANNSAPKFTFERVANTPFSENKYFTSIGMQTDEHIELLKKFEKVLSSR